VITAQFLLLLIAVVAWRLYCRGHQQRRRTDVYDPYEDWQ